MSQPRTNPVSRNESSGLRGTWSPRRGPGVWNPSPTKQNEATYGPCIRTTQGTDGGWIPVAYGASRESPEGRS
jgi:hypothetical protein